MNTRSRRWINDQMGEGYPVDGHGLSWSGSHASTVPSHILVRRGGQPHTYVPARCSCWAFLSSMLLFQRFKAWVSRGCVCACVGVCGCVWVYMCTCVLIQHVRLNMDSFMECGFTSGGQESGLHSVQLYPKYRQGSAALRFYCHCRKLSLSRWKVHCTIQQALDPLEVEWYGNTSKCSPQWLSCSSSLPQWGEVSPLLAEPQAEAGRML